MKVTIAVGEIATCAFDAKIYFDKEIVCKYKKSTIYKDNGTKPEEYVKTTLIKILCSLEGKAKAVAIECPFFPRFTEHYGEKLAKRYVMEWVVQVLSELKEPKFKEIALICGKEDYQDLCILTKSKLTYQLNV